MKKIFCFAMALIMCLSLFSCGTTNSKSKFAGTYERNGFLNADVEYRDGNGQKHLDHDFLDGKFTLVLNSDGTGTETFEITHMDSKYTLSYPERVKEMGTSEITWNTDGQYINITFKGVTYSDPDSSFFLTSTPRETNYTSTYELKGAQLINIESESGGYTKIS